MARKGSSKLRNIKVDLIYKNKMVAKLINRSMKDGKKSVATKEVYRAFEIIKEESKEDPLKIFSQALDNIRPTMEVRPRRIGGAAYQVPISVRGPRKDSLSIRWLIKAANLRPNGEYKTFAQKLAAEILEASKGEGGAVKKRQEIERVAEANRAFAHFRW
ncbi:MAG TPA: 30S ribosomal protein S7 [Patescibacteria group bacterium]|nr:30S ribosomal protein S7 [Patescibacteria group bacterium]